MNMPALAWVILRYLRGLGFLPEGDAHHLVRGVFLDVEVAFIFEQMLVCEQLLEYYPLRASLEAAQKAYPFGAGWHGSDT